MRLEGRVAIVTGGGRGIGRAECLSLAGEGAAVIVNDFGGAADGSGGEPGPADEVADAITAAGGKAIPHYGDVADPSTGDDLVQLALDRFGRLDILVNNAGILRDRMLHNMSDAEWNAVIAIHLTGTFNGTRAAAKVFREQRGGVGAGRVHPRRLCRALPLCQRPRHGFLRKDTPAWNTPLGALRVRRRRAPGASIFEAGGSL